MLTIYLSQEPAALLLLQPAPRAVLQVQLLQLRQHHLGGGAGGQQLDILRRLHHRPGQQRRGHAPSPAPPSAVHAPRQPRLLPPLAGEAEPERGRRGEPGAAQQPQSGPQG